MDGKGRYLDNIRHFFAAVFGFAGVSARNLAQENTARSTL